jgi:hypothetical protein
VDDRAQPPAILASDTERERSVGVLRDAVVEGRLTLEEFSERVEHVQTARTDRELAVLTADLPAPGAPSADAAPAEHRAVFSRLTRGGAWELPARSSWRSVFGTIYLDLREVRLGCAEVELSIYNLFGTVRVRVPPGVRVEVTGGGAFASQVIDPPPWPAPRGAPLLRIHASGPGGTLYVSSSEPRRALTR